jgi:ABC-2 type transport system permease protein
MKAIYKRELASYFNSMVGYVFVAVLTLFIGIYFTAINLFNGYPHFSYVLLNTLMIFMLAIPVLTMRSMAEDRKNKNDQLLLTSPVTVTGMVMGKYLAMVTVFAVPVLISCLCPLIIAANGTAYLKDDYATIFAFFLLGCAYIAIGMFISALTESQVIAAVGTFAVLLLLYLWGNLMNFLPTAVSKILSTFTFSDVLNNFAYYNMFDVGGLFLYLSVAAIFVFLTVQAVLKRRWS